MTIVFEIGKQVFAGKSFKIFEKMIKNCNTCMEFLIL